jgi:hypothetical protein
MQNEAINNLQKEIEARKALLAFIEEKGLTVDSVSSVGLVEPNEGFAFIEVRFPVLVQHPLTRLEAVSQGMLERMKSTSNNTD